jgi:glycosyltransferase involved in cell wall biosynthesis
VRVIFSVDAIRLPLSGVGRYVWELGSRLPRLPEIELLRYYSRGKWIERIESLVDVQAKGLIERSARPLIRSPGWWREWRALRGHENEIFHAPNFFLPRFCGAGVATVHDLSVVKFPQSHPVERIREFERKLARSLKDAAHVITVSEAVRAEVIEEFGLSREKVTAVLHGVSERFNPSQEAENTALLKQAELVSRKYVLCVSTLEPRKGIVQLIDAYDGLPSELRKGWPLVIAGCEGWLNDAIRERIRRAERNGWLRYLGYVNELELPKLYNQARAAVYPSLYEGFGFPMVEAMASGVPVLTSECRALVEVSGGAALHVNPDDVGALRGGLEKVILDEQWRSEARARGLVVTKKLSWGRCAEETVAVYRGLVQ